VVEIGSTGRILENERTQRDHSKKKAQKRVFFSCQEKKTFSELLVV
jgi:hypothetical protein